MKRLPMIVAVAFVGCLSGQVALACTCDRTPRTADELLANYDGVLIGEVVRIDLVENCAQRSDGRVSCYDEKDVTLRVWKSWKGVATPFLVVRTGGGDADCGFDFKVGWRYVVFARSG